MLPASLCAKIMVFRRITRIIEVVLNERAVEEYFLFAFYFPMDRNERSYHMDRAMFHIPFLIRVFQSNCNVVCENGCICEIILNEKRN